MSLSKGFPPAVAVCLSSAVSQSGCFGRKEGMREEGREGGKRMSVHPVFLSVKKKGIGHFLKIQISQSEREDDAGRNT